MKTPSLGISLIPVILLIGLLSISVTIYGDEMLSGPSQLVLAISTAVAVGIAMFCYGQKWEDLEQAMVHSISRTMPANLILLMVGGLCGTWMHAGIIPTMIYYGLDVISARWLLITACLLCSLVSLCIGSSWTTIATIGIGLMGVGRTLGIDDWWVAGAIISGAYFGDKMSPLSETTNLASSTAGVLLFTHICNMLFTTVPSIIITLLIYLVVGIMGDATDGGGDAMVAAAEVQQHLDESFLVTPWLLLIPVGVFYLIYKGLSATVVLFIGMLVGAIIVGFRDGFEFAMSSAFGPVSSESGYEVIDSLTGTRGMAGMLNTIWLILMSMCFGGVMEHSGMLSRITSQLLKIMVGRVSTVLTTCLSCLFINVSTGDQSLAIILPSKMYGEAYKRLNLPKKLLSRTLEDSGTVTSVLIPWNSCGMTQSTVLGVATLAYAPFAFFCWISPIMTILVAAITGKINKSK